MYCDTSRFIDSVSVNEHSVCARRRVFPSGNDQIHPKFSFSCFLFLCLLSSAIIVLKGLPGTLRELHTGEE